MSSSPSSDTGVTQIKIFPQGHHITLMHFTNVTNTKAIRTKLFAHEIPEMALIDANAIASINQVLAAASKALMYQNQNALNVNSLHAEIIFGLSPDRKINDAFKYFGASDKSTDILIGLLDTSESIINEIRDVVEGQLDTDLDASFNISQISGEKLKKIIKLYKLQDLEIAPPLNLEDAIINKIATKHCI